MSLFLQLHKSQPDGPADKKATHLKGNHSNPHHRNRKKKLYPLFQDGGFERYWQFLLLSLINEHRQSGTIVGFASLAVALRFFGRIFHPFLKSAGIISEKDGCFFNWSCHLFILLFAKVQQFSDIACLTSVFSRFFLIHNTSKQSPCNRHDAERCFYAFNIQSS